MNATKYNMLIIDPQNDFHETFINENQIEQPGNLAVTGATADSARIADFITNNRENINKIFVSLDTHTPNHIGHPGYWKTDDSTGETPVEPGAWTVFSLNGNNEIVGSDTKIYTPKRKIGEDATQYNKRVEFTKYYIQTVPSKGKGPALIWPTHCLEGKPGHEVNAALRDALQQYDNSQGRLEYHIKGQNELVEMYSIFKAEIPMEDDFTDSTFTKIQLDPPTKDNMTLYYTGDKPFKTSSKINNRDTDREDGAYLQTSFNEVLFNSLTSGQNPIIICGEALSHCVNWSLRDLVTNLLERQTAGYYDTSRQKLMQGQVILLVNCSSRVQGMNDDFLKNVADLNEFCLKYNVTLNIVDENNELKPNNDSNEFVNALKKYQEREATKAAAPPAQGGTRKRRRHKNRRTKSKPKRSKKTHNRKPRHRRRTRK